MAKILPGPMAAQISGSIGGTVFSRNRYGAYTRTKVTPVNPDTLYQQNIRSTLATVSSSFAALTAAQKKAWKGWAQANPINDSLGQQLTLSPNAAYCALNSRLIQAGASQISVPPIVPAPDGLTSLSLVADIGAGDVAITFAPTPLQANQRLWVTAAVVNSAGIGYVKNLLKLVTISAAAQATGLVIESDLESRFGSLSVGQVVHLRCAVFDDDTGLLSTPLACSVAVTST